MMLWDRAVPTIVGGKLHPRTRYAFVRKAPRPALGQRAVFRPQANHVEWDDGTEGWCACGHPVGDGYRLSKMQEAAMLEAGDAREEARRAYLEAEAYIAHKTFGRVLVVEDGPPVEAGEAPYWFLTIDDEKQSFYSLPKAAYAPQEIEAAARVVATRGPGDFTARGFVRTFGRTVDDVLRHHGETFRAALGQLGLRVEAVLRPPHTRESVLARRRALLEGRQPRGPEPRHGLRVSRIR